MGSVDKVDRGGDGNPALPRQELTAAPAQGAAQPPESPRARWMARLRRLGVAGFAFFLIKGLAWLLVPLAYAWYANR